MNSRAVMLEQQFTNIHMDNYPNVSSYCQALKMIADQLANVGAPVSETRLVLQLITHVSDAYSGIATIIQQSDPLPPFYKARSMLNLEESRRATTSPVSPSASDSALLSSQSDASVKTNNRSASAAPKGGNSSYSNKSKGGRNNRSNYRGKNNGGGNYKQHNGRHGQHQHGQSNNPTTWTWVPVSPWQQQGWPTPPCPYPNAGWAPPTNSRGAGILGPRPQHAFLAQPPTVGPSQGVLVPTDLAAVMQSLNIQQPDDNYYMDTGASSHMTSNHGNLSSYSYLSSPRHIVVGNGNLIPIVGYGAASLPPPHNSLLLKNVLHVPAIIKNLVSVRKFTTDNNVSC
ncbi:uncharacterized protein LOC141632434 [Silene latifolia]|uniref:uncharacterized protein LOC141632434 n=1 Tax=Silene latifolia TaxID=37657 RepID=UPI003D78A6F7